MSKSKVGDQIVTVDRRRGSRREEVAVEAVSAPAPVERRRKQRRRQIDPTTCERDYTQDEMEFMHALDAYKRSSNRMFPTCSEVLEVLRGLGYVKASELEDETVCCSDAKPCNC